MQNDDFAGSGSGGVQVTYRVKITPKLVFSIVGPYVYEKVMEQVKAIAPVTLFMLAFQLLVLRFPLKESAVISVGLSCVILGLMFFIDGLRLGVMPLGENIGSTLPAKSGLTIIMTTAFLLGMIANFAEPAIATLKTLGGSISYDKAPLLYDFLNYKTGTLLTVTSIGVGIGAINGMFRLIKGWSLKTTVIPGLIVVVVLTFIAALDRNAKDIVGLAWDAGGITTGTVTAPLVLALGVGMAAVLGKGETGMSGFGIITLCSIWPIACVLSYTLVCSWGGFYLTPQEYAAIPKAVADVVAGNSASAVVESIRLIGNSFLNSCTSVLPLIGLLIVVQKWVLKEEIRNLDQVIAGVIFALLGLLLFKIGLEKGLNPLGQQVGGSAINAFSPDGGLFGTAWGKVIVLLFGFAVGYGATLAEPALAALGMTVEEITAGAFKKFLVMHTVGFGVGVGLVIGVAKIMFGWPALAIILPSYILVLTLTVFSEEQFVNIGWDSGGVTTGDITSPVLIALGLGVAAAVGGADGFTLIAMGSVWPIIAVLALGIFIDKTTPSVRTE
ncbi:MAG TPA: DUF1538 domain-containing protein [bacterium]|nr:DUF1538 domain-containing protein [bacterium]